MELTEAQVEYLEKFGRNYEALGGTRAAGKFFALFLITQETFSLEELAQTVGTSKGTASTSLRILNTYGIVEHTTKPGDRKDYYRIHPDAWRRMLEASVPKTQMFRDLFRSGQEVATPESRELLEEFDTSFARVQEIVLTAIEQVIREQRENKEKKEKKEKQETARNR